MTQVDLGAPRTRNAGSRTRAVPATLIAVGAAPYRRGSRAVRLTRLGVAAAMWVVVALALGPVGPSVNDYLAAATRARASYRYDRALTWYSRAEVAAPSDPRPYCLTGDVRSAQHEWSLAAAAYLRCLNVHPREPASAWLGLGDARSALGDVSGAVMAWGRSADAGGTDAIRRLGKFYESEGNLDAATAAWRRLPATDVEATAHLGMFALWHGDTAAAQAYFAVARAHSTASSLAQAEGNFLPLAALHSLDASAWGKLGYAFLVANLPALALRPLQTATLLDAGSDSAHAYLGWTYWLLGQGGLTPNGTVASYTADAQAEIKAALALNPDNGFAWFVAETLAAAGGNLVAGSNDIAKAEALDQRNPVIWTSAGELAVARSDYLGAEIDLGNAARLSSRPDETVVLLQFYHDLGYGLATGRAMAAAAAAVARWPSNEPIRFLQAEIADGAGSPDLAIAAAQEALLLDPTDPAPYVLLGRYALQAARYVAAAAYLRVALALEPHGPWASSAAALLAPLHSLDV